MSGSCPHTTGETHTLVNKESHFGNQDSFEAYGQEVLCGVPRRGHGFAHEARRPRHRGDRPVQPEHAAFTIEIKSDRAQYWLGVGAQPTDQVLNLLKITGDWQKFKGLKGAEGTLKTAAAKPEAAVLVEEAENKAQKAQGRQGRSRRQGSRSRDPGRGPAR